MTVRDPRTGRFVATANAPESREPRYAPAGDELAQGGQSPLRADNPELVHPDDQGYHNAVLRTAARNAGPMDSSAFLTGLVGHTAPSTGTQDDEPGSPSTEPVRGGLRPAMRGQGRGRWLPSLRDRS